MIYLAGARLSATAHGLHEKDRDSREYCWLPLRAEHLQPLRRTTFWSSKTAPPIMAYNLQHEAMVSRTRQPGGTATSALSFRPNSPRLDVADDERSRCLRERIGERARDIPIIMITARPRKPIRWSVSKWAPDDWCKPFSVEVLLGRIKRSWRLDGGAEPADVVEHL